MDDAKSNTKNLPGIAQMLVTGGLIDMQTAQGAVAAARKQNNNLVHYLVENEIIPARELANLGSQDFGVPLLDIDCFETEIIPIDLVSEKLIRHHNALPLFKRRDTLFIAVIDPSQQLTLDEIKFHTGFNTRAVVVEADKLNGLIESALSAKEDAALDEFLDDGDHLDDLDFESGDTASKEDDTNVADDAPIVRFVNKILLDAINRGASDIHFEPYESRYRVRLRVDGILHEVANPPLNLGARIAARLKIMSQLDISERRIPQDGRFKMNLSRKRAIDFRVSTCPTVGGEKVVMRLLDPTSAQIGVEKLGFTDEQKTLFLNAIKEPQGMILVTGPTGSGKTVTLYTALNILNTPEKNISTAEDPVELKVNGINQVNMNPKAGLTFSSTLRSFLRQDPDIIMVGEMRDLETAEIGVKAAQTGHLVLSTLHTNSAPETLTRLTNMGVAPYNIAGSVSLIVAQRLARCLCENCKKPCSIPANILVKAGVLKEGESKDTYKMYEPSACDKCTHGYKGRVGLYEVLHITKTIGDMIMQGATSLDLRRQAISEGMKTIYESGINLVRQGVTSLNEIERVTKE